MIKLSVALLLLLTFIYPCQSKAQQADLFVVVVKDGMTLEPLVGATIMQKNTTHGAKTDAEGKAQLKVSEQGMVLFTIRYVGYVSKDISVLLPRSDTVFNILLEPNEAHLEAVTISSVRTNSRIEDIPTRIEVLGLDDMQEENGIKPGNIMSLLGDIAGIQMQQVSASSGNTFARIQGLNGRYTQLLKDGMPLFGGLSGGFSILQIPPIDLKQIEIIKGSVSTLYGGDAIAGIINLVSKDASATPEFDITANVTSLYESNLNAYYSRRSKKVGVTFFAGQTLQRQTDVDKDGLTDAPRVNSIVIHPKLIFYLNPKSTLTLNYSGTFDRRQGGEIDYFAKGSDDTMYHVNNCMQRNTGDAKWLYTFSKASNLTVKVSGSFLNQHLDTKHYFFNATQRIYYSEISYVQKRKNMDWVAGVNVNGDRFKSMLALFPGVKDYRYRTYGVFVQNTWKPWQKMTVESGLRGDYHSGFGFFPLPRLSLMYKFSNPITARLNGGCGYKVPNVITYADAETELDHLSTSIHLKPEWSKGINGDLNFNKTLFEKLNVTLNQSFFYTDISQPVYDSSTNSAVVSLVNASQAIQSRGLQTYARIRYEVFELYAGYVFTQVRKLYDLQLPDMVVTPRHNLSATFFYEYEERWRVGFESSYIAHQLNQDYQRVRNYVLLAAMIQYRSGILTLVLNAENLADVRQSKFEKIYDGTISDPVFHKLWAPIDGRVINLSVKLAL